jgi:hypothetical protein
MRTFIITLFVYLVSVTTALADTQLFASVSPGFRTAQVGVAVTTFAAVINAGAETATAVSVAVATVVDSAAHPATDLPADFLYQTLDTSGHLIGTANTPVDIPAGGTQLFLLAITPTAPIAWGTFDNFAKIITFTFQGTNTSPAPTYFGVNTFSIRAGNTPTPDIIAASATCPSDDGIPAVNIPGSGGVTAFAVAAVNIGPVATAPTVTARSNLGQSFPICRTNPQTGECLDPTLISMPVGEVVTYSVFVGSDQEVPFDPANTRIYVRFTVLPGVHGGFLYGETSVAFRTHSPACAP